MKLFKMFIAAAALALTTASTAHAGQKVLASAPAVLAAPGDTLYCDVTNLDPVNSIDVTGEAMDLNGAVISGSTITIPPGAGQFFAGVSTAGTAWCRFTVTGSTKNLRAMAIYDNNSSYTLSLPAY